MNIRLTASALPEDAARHINSFPMTDAGNGELFADLYADELRYGVGRGWLRFKAGAHWWTPMHDDEMRPLATEVARLRQMAALQLPAKTKDEMKARDEAVKAALNLENIHRLDAMLKLARGSDKIHTPDDFPWDANPWLLGVLNGVVDLKTGELRDGKPDDYITKHARCAYKPGATPERFDQFVREIFSDANGTPDAKLIGWMWRCLGYSATGSTEEEIFTVNTGDGGNGKSTLYEPIAHALGDYAYAAPFATFDQAQRHKVSNDLAALAGKRFVLAAEPNEQIKLNSGRMKWLTGGDSITARFLHKENFTFTMQATFHLLANKKPTIDDQSKGMWRRIYVIPYSRQYEGAARDTKLKQFFKESVREQEGILARLVAGAVAWQSKPLSVDVPAAVTKATVAYRTESDKLAEYFRERIVVDPAATAVWNKLYLDYQIWCKECGMKDGEYLLVSDFHALLKARYPYKHTKHGNAYVGFRVRTSDDPPPYDDDDRPSQGGAGAGERAAVQPAAEMTTPALAGLDAADAAAAGAIQGNVGDGRNRPVTAPSPSFSLISRQKTVQGDKVTTFHTNSFAKNSLEENGAKIVTLSPEANFPHEIRENGGERAVIAENGPSPSPAPPRASAGVAIMRDGPDDPASGPLGDDFSISLHAIRPSDTAALVELADRHPTAPPASDLERRERLYWLAVRHALARGETPEAAHELATKWTTTQFGGWG